MPEKRLLICDDEPAFLRFVKDPPPHAQDLRYAVRVTTDSDDFIEAYDAFEPTTIVLDMIMLGMDGNELVRWLGSGMHGARHHHHRIYARYPTHAKTLAEVKGLGW